MSIFTILNQGAKSSAIRTQVGHAFIVRRRESIVSMMMRASANHLFVLSSLNLLHSPRRRGQGRKPKLERLRRMQARGERDDLYAPESSTSSLTPLSSEYTPLPQLSPHEAFVPKVSSSPSPPPYIPFRPLPSASTSFENHSRDIELILLKNEIGELQSRNEVSRSLHILIRESS